MYSYYFGLPNNTETETNTINYSKYGHCIEEKKEVLRVNISKYLIFIF